MVNVFLLILLAAIIGWLVGFFRSDGDFQEANETAFGAGVGCGYSLFQIILIGIGMLFVLWFLGALFN